MVIFKYGYLFEKYTEIFMDEIIAHLGLLQNNQRKREGNGDTGETRGAKGRAAEVTT